MPRHHVVRMLPYAPEELFEMVGDVDAYPEFVPWITGLKSWNRHAEGEGIDVLFVTGGLAAEQFGPEIDAPEPDLLRTWLAARQHDPQYAIGRLR